MEQFIDKKHNNEKIVAISCYTAPIAKICAKYCDMILVGDTVGMTIYGHKNTQNVTIDMMINHGKAVKQAVGNKFTIFDMPFGSYEKDKYEALTNAEKILKETQADALKLEGGIEIEDTLRYLKSKNINIVGHIGLLPQKFAQNSKYKIQGEDEIQKQKITDDLTFLNEIGINIIIIEGVFKEFTDSLINNKSQIFIGIGASDNCDGQILVSDDILGLTYGINIPKFAKQYVDSKKLFDKAINNYSKEVKMQKFPNQENFYYPKK